MDPEQRQVTLNALAGRRIEVYLPRQRSGNWVMPESSDEHIVEKIKAYLPAGPTKKSGYREHDLLQFYAVNGGLRTIRVKDIVNIR